jgi:hypothetical protein
MLSAFLVQTDASSQDHLMLAEVESQAGNPTAAIAQYRKVLEEDSRDIVALNRLAHLLADKANQPDEALKYAQQARSPARGRRPPNAGVTSAGRRGHRAPGGSDHPLYRKLPGSRLIRESAAGARADPGRPDESKQISGRVCG